MIKIKQETGSIAVYVSVVVISMLLILFAVFLTSSSKLKSQIETTIAIKQSYEADNSKAGDIYNSLVKKSESKVVYMEDFNSSASYTVNATTYSVNNGIITLQSSSADPTIYMSNVTSFNPNEFRYIDVRYRLTQGSGNMEFFMIENPTDQTYAISQEVIADGEWHILTIDLWSNTSVKSRNPITGWRWDWISSSNAIMEVDYIKIRE